MYRLCTYQDKAEGKLDSKALKCVLLDIVIIKRAVNVIFQLLENFCKYGCSFDKVDAYFRETKASLQGEKIFE